MMSAGNESFKNATRSIASSRRTTIDSCLGIVAVQRISSTIRNVRLQKALLDLGKANEAVGLDFYEDPNCEEGYNSDDDIVDLHYASDGYENTHKRFCIDDFCDVCDDMNMRKYSPLWR